MSTEPDPIWQDTEIKYLRDKFSELISLNNQVLSLLLLITPGIELKHKEFADTIISNLQKYLEDTKC